MASLATALSAGVGAQACTGAPPPPADALVVLVEAEAGDLDPRLGLTALSDKVGRLIHARLVTVDNDASEPRFDLAESLEHPDPLTYTFTLRPDAVFHDGQPLTAQDVAYTYRSLMDPALASPKASMVKDVGAVEVSGPRQVTFRLTKPYAPFLANLEFGIVAERHTGPDGRLVGPPVGAGPFRFERDDGAGGLVLRRHDRWHGQGPRVDRVAIRVVRDDNTRLLALMAGSGHLVQNGVSPLLLPALERRPGLRVVAGPSTAISYLGFNLEDPALRDVRVRRAIAHALDRQGIVDRKFKGRARLATGLFAPGHFAYEGDVATYAHDPPRARALLDAAGLPDPDGDGPAPRLRLTLKTTTNRFRRSVALVLAHQLAEVGIRVDVRAYEWGTFFHDVRSGNFQLHLLQWPVIVEPDMVHWIFHSDMIPTDESRGRGGNRGRYRSAEVDRLIERGSLEQDPAGRRAIYAEIQRRLALDLPYVFLWHEDNLAVVREELEGWRVIPTGRLAPLTEVRWTDR